MPLNIPENAQSVENRSKVDVQNSLPSSNPFLPNSWISALISAFTNRIFDFYQNLNEAMIQSFWDTSTDDFLDRQASWFGVSRKEATQGTGNIVVTGVLATVVPASTQFETIGGKIYTTDILKTIITNPLSVNSITYVGLIATVITDIEHNMASGNSVLITGAIETAYNGTFPVTVVNEFEFFYTLASTPTATPGTGTIIANHSSALVPVSSLLYSSEENLDSGEKLTISTPITNIDDDAYVDSDGLRGGTDIEVDEIFRQRFLDKVGSPVAHFSENEIHQKALEIEGVTRVFVNAVTPNIGQVTVYFVRDNDLTIKPDAGEITEVKDKILEIKPANISDDSVIVVGPTTVIDLDFTFASITPDTTTMRQAIEDNLDLMFKTIAGVGFDLPENDYVSAINGTIDPITGQRLESFSLTSPSGIQAIADDNILILGAMNF